MNPEQLKALVGRAALQYVVPGALVGVGTGSTANHFIDALAEMRDRIAGAVSSSDKSTERLRGHGIRVLEAADVQSLPVYIDGADEVDPKGHMIKGGGAALTREKIVADLAERFVCIADESKLVPVLGVDHRIHTFTGGGTLTFTQGGTIDYILVVAGGGAGGNQSSASGGGGGAGGVIYVTGTPVSPGAYTIVVGAGGVAALNSQGGDGGNSSIAGLGLTAVGGGGGGAGSSPGTGGGRPGGSGGGGSNWTPAPGGARTLGQGNVGGAGGGRGAGGGGWSGGGGNGGSTAGGLGGSGNLSDIGRAYGDSIPYAGGGGGGDGIAPGGSGGSSVGGTGAGGATPATAGMTNRGGGGGGGFGTTPAADGGSGIVIVSYILTPPSRGYRGIGLVRGSRG